jgi:4,5-dihydroxyphthalate decarboxylase
VAEVEETRALMGDDPFPHGIRRNPKTVETLAGYSFRQGLAPRRPAVEELFYQSLLDT